MDFYATSQYGYYPTFGCLLQLMNNFFVFNKFHTGNRCVEISPRNAPRTDTEKTKDSILNKISSTSNVCRP